MSDGFDPPLAHQQGSLSRVPVPYTATFPVHRARKQKWTLQRPFSGFMLKKVTLIADGNIPDSAFRLAATGFGCPDCWDLAQNRSRRADESEER